MHKSIDYFLSNNTQNNNNNNNNNNFGGMALNDDTENEANYSFISQGPAASTHMDNKHSNMNNTMNNRNRYHNHNDNNKNNNSNSSFNNDDFIDTAADSNNESIEQPLLHNNNNNNNNENTRDIMDTNMIDTSSNNKKKKTSVNSDSDDDDDNINGNTTATTISPFNYTNTDYYITWFCFFILGVFNNFAYVVILSAAKSLADSFDESNLIGVESWALIGIGFIFKSMNAFFLEHISHKIRILCTSLAFFIGIFMLGFSVYINFEFAIFAIVIIGGACSFGESVILGYLRLFPSKISGAWGSGTGMAGLAASGIYLLLSDILNFENQIIFFMMLPTVFCYLIAFFVTWNNTNIRKVVIYGKKNDNNNNGNNNIVNSMNTSTTTTIMIESEIETETQWNKIIRCFKLVWFPCVMLCLVYMFEYVISVGLAQLANTNESNKIQDRNYVILQICYQFGVFLSRSSLSLVKLPYFGTMTFIQFLNFIIWHLHCIYLWFDEPAQFILMVFVGLLGGAMYVNVVYWILSTKIVPKQDKELCINIMSIWVNIGITSSSVYELIMDNTFFAYLVKKSK